MKLKEQSAEHRAQLRLLGEFEIWNLKLRMMVAIPGGNGILYLNLNLKICR